MESVRAIGMLAACMLLAVSGVCSSSRRHRGEDPAVSSKKKSDDPKDIMVLIPSYSKDVSDNGCRVRANPQETFSGPDIDIRHVPFAELISETIGRYSVRAILDAPNSSPPPWHRSMRICARWSSSTCCATGCGRDGLHTFFFMSAAQHAPAIRDALAAAGMNREHELFVKAMELFGPDFPVDNDARAKRFSYSSLDTPLNDFDVKHAGDRPLVRPARHARQGHGRLRRAHSGAVAEDRSQARTAGRGRPPALSQSGARAPATISGTSRTRKWSQALASLPTEHRTLLAMDIFNAEFSNGGVHQFFFNSSGAVAPEVYDAFRELGLERQAAIYKRALDMFPAQLPARHAEAARQILLTANGARGTSACRSSPTISMPSTGAPRVVRVGDKAAAVEGGPGIWSRHGQLRPRKENASLLSQRCCSHLPR